MYLFILESIGTSELFLIGIVALIVFGPRKLPEIARMVGKTMADFRRTTNDFKSTWEKEVSEVNFDDDGKNNNYIETPKPADYPVQRETKQIEQNSVLSPEIKEISSEDMKKLLKKDESNTESVEIKPHAEPQANDKRSWL